MEIVKLKPSIAKFPPKSKLIEQTIKTVYSICEVDPHFQTKHAKDAQKKLKESRIKSDSKTLELKKLKEIENNIISKNSIINQECESLKEDLLYKLGVELW